MEEQIAVDREGTFIAEIYEYGVIEASEPSKAVGVLIKAKLVDIWDFGNKEWVTWEEYEQVAEGVIWVVKKDGSVNTNGAESLIKNAGWDGKFSSVVLRGWEPSRCQVVIKQDTYNNETRYRISFVNALSATPGGGGNVDPDGAKLLDDRFGNQFRALAGNAALNKPKESAGKKDRPGKPPAMDPKAEPVNAGTPPSDIPF